MALKREHRTDGNGKRKPQRRLVQPAKVGFFTKIRNYFLTGLIVTAPLGLSLYIAWLVIDWVDDTVTPFIPARFNPETYININLPGIGLLAAFVGLTFIGLVTANFFGRSIVAFGESLVDRMPVVRTLYGALKQIFETVLQNSSQSFRQVVLVEYPRKGLWVLAFVSGDTRGEVRRLIGEEGLNVFVPTTPNPTSGFLLFVPEKDVVYMDMSVEEAAKLIISAGVITPPDPHAQISQPPRQQPAESPKEVITS